MWADRLGTRLVLTRIVAWWSTFTIATAAAMGQGSLLAIRFLFGMGKPARGLRRAARFRSGFHVASEELYRGSSLPERHLSGGLTPSLVLALIAFHQLAKAVRALRPARLRVGLGVAPLVSRRPGRPSGSECRGTFGDRRRARWHSPHATDWVFWRRLLGQRNMISLCLLYFPNSVVFYFCITWLPTFLQEKHGFSDTRLGFFSGLPLLLSVAADLFGGVTTDWAVARFGLRLGCAGLGCVAYTVARWPRSWPR